MKKIISVLLLLLVAVVAYGIISPDSMPVSQETKDKLYALQLEGSKAFDKASIVAKDLGTTAKEVGKIAYEKGKAGVQTAGTALKGVEEKAKDGLVLAQNGVDKAITTAENSTKKIANVINPNNSKQVNAKTLEEPVPVIDVKIHKNPNDDISVAREVEAAKARYNAKNSTPSEATQAKKIVTTTPKENVKANEAEKKLTPVKKEIDNLENNKIYKTLSFNFNSKELTSETVKTLNSIALNKNAKILIIGHTDNVGSKASNSYYSKERANNVKKFFLKKGVNQDQILVEFRGATNPIKSNSDLKGRRANRRVEVLIEN